MTKQNNDELDEILDKVSLRSSRGYTKVGLKQAINALISKRVVEARIDELQRIMKGQKTVTQYADLDFNDLITYVFSADEIHERMNELTKPNNEGE